MNDHGSQVGHTFTSMPAWPTKKVYIFGEALMPTCKCMSSPLSVQIVSAAGFDCAKKFHFAEAQLVLPSRVTADPSCTAQVQSQVHSFN